MTFALDMIARGPVRIVLHRNDDLLCCLVAGWPHMGKPDARSHDCIFFCIFKTQAIRPSICLKTENKNWSGRQDSNLRPSAPKADALPGCATPRSGQFWSAPGGVFPDGLVGPEGLEPPT